MPYWFDGNNLIGRSAAAAKSDAGTRRAFLSTLSSLHRSGGGRFLVYFDGDDPDRAAMPPGISVRYSAPYSADEAMARRLREIQHPAEIIIVTNDRQLMSTMPERRGENDDLAGIHREDADQVRRSPKEECAGKTGGCG